VGELVYLEQSTIHSKTRWTSVYLSFSYSVNALCHPVYTYLLFLLLLMFMFILAFNFM